MTTISTAPAGPSHRGAEPRAGVVRAAGSVPRVERVATMTRTPGTTSIAVAAAPLNPLDLAVASGTFHSVRHEAPYVPGVECVGTVVESDTFATGTWVYAECHPSPTTPGALATHVVVPDASVLVLPDGLDPVAAAAVGNAGVAAYLPLVVEAGLRQGDAVLVLGATGAVGQLAVQVARGRGAARVVGVGRDAAALEQLRELGADDVVALRPDEGVEPLAARMLAAAGPVDVVLDGVFGAPLEAALRACGPRARIVNIGNAAGATVQLPAGLLRGQQLTLTGFAGLHTPLREKRAALTWLWGALAAGELRLRTRTSGLDELPEAWRLQATSPHGKCVVLPHGQPPARTTAPPSSATHESEK